MPKIICVANQKVGVGKTTTAVNIASSIAIFEQNTLLIDCDPQGDAGACMGIEKKNLSQDLYDVFMGKASEEEVTENSCIDYLKIIPSRLNLVQAEHKLALKPGKEMVLSRFLKNSSEKYEYIIIDTPSSLGFFTVCAMAASDWMVIPLQCSYYALESFRHLLEVVQIVREQLNSNLKIAGILLTMSKNKNEFRNTYAEDAVQGIEDVLFSVTIPECMELQNEPGCSSPLALQDINSRGAKSYFELSYELIDFFCKKDNSKNY